MTYPKYDYVEYPKSLPRDDYWGQVRRTVGGESVSEEQILMIVNAIRNGLRLESTENCLDIACGNGALSSRLFPYCKFLLGVDFSPYLIEIADEVFQVELKSKFLISDVASYVFNEKTPEVYDKGFCYGSFSYFSQEDAVLALTALRERFVNIRIFYIGNLPDKARYKNFYSNGEDCELLLSDHKTQIGIWRTEGEMIALANSCGWDAKITVMPENFYGSKFRFDVILTPK
jgi:SAM-dependent methyltransferase